LENSTIQPEFKVQSVLLIALSIVLGILVVAFGIHQIQMSDPYVREVLAQSGNVERGHAMFQMNCAGCHGVQADGKVGPSLRDISDRRSQFSLIHQVVSGQTPPMPQFQANPQEMADLLSYLKTL
jgi:mono/diheme cytochrome c family protein